MRSVKIKRPVTGKEFAAGPIVADDEELQHLGDRQRSSPCPFCDEYHEWYIKDAYLERESDPFSSAP
jgi:hypothetical protein